MSAVPGEEVPAFDHSTGVDIITRAGKCEDCGEAVSMTRFNGSCDSCLHFREPLHEVDWYDGPIVVCDECRANTPDWQNVNRWWTDDIGGDDA